MKYMLNSIILKLRPSLKHSLFAVPLPDYFGWVGRYIFFSSILFPFKIEQWGNNDFLWKIGIKNISKRAKNVLGSVVGGGGGGFRWVG